MNKLHDTIREAVFDKASQTGVVEIRIGLGYSAVMLDNGNTGLAATLLKDLPAHCTRFDGRQFLRPKSAFTLVEKITSDNMIETALALAAVNALLNTAMPNIVSGDILEIARIMPSDRVGMVGHFAPLVAPINKIAKDLLIFEQSISSPNGQMLPASETNKRLPGCQVAIITATAIINHSIEDLLAASRHCRAVIILGASTPLLADLFADTPVTLLSGVVVTQPEKVFEVISLGGGTQLFKKYVQKVNVNL